MKVNICVDFWLVFNRAFRISRGALKCRRLPCSCLSCISSEYKKVVSSRDIDPLPFMATKYSKAYIPIKIVHHTLSNLLSVFIILQPQLFLLVLTFSFSSSLSVFSTGTVLFMGRVMHPEAMNASGHDFEKL